MTRKTKFICGYCNEEKDQEDMADQDFCEGCMCDVRQAFKKRKNKD